MSAESLMEIEGLSPTWTAVQAVAMLCANGEITIKETTAPNNNENCNVF